MENNKETERFEELFVINEEACRAFKAHEDKIMQGKAPLDLTYFKLHYAMMKSCYDLNKERLRIFKLAANRDTMTQAFLNANRIEEAKQSQALHAEAQQMVREYSDHLSNMRFIIETANQSINKYETFNNYGFENLVVDMKKCSDVFMAITLNENYELTDRMGALANQIKCWTVAKAIQEKLNGKVFVKTEDGYEEQK